MTTYFWCPCCKAVIKHPVTCPYCGNMATIQIRMPRKEGQKE